MKEEFNVLTQSAFDALYTGTFNNLGGTAQTEDHTAGIAAIPTTDNTAAIGAIKVTTDKFAFTISNQVDSNMLTHTATIPSSYITAAGIAASALNDKGNWNIGKAGYSLAGTTDVNVIQINGVTVIGVGTSGNLWRA